MVALPVFSYVQIRLLLVLLLAWACWGCRLQTSAESAFVRVDSAHFVVYAATSRRDAEGHARKLEGMLQGLLETGWDHHGTLPLKLNVILVEDEAEFALLRPLNADGYFVEDELFEQWVVLLLHHGQLRPQVLVHELSHALSQLALQNQPVWFSEGLAVYYETARLADGEFVLGVPAYGRLGTLLKQGILPAATLFSGNHPHDVRFYASAWLLVHYLMTEHSDAFVRYQELLGQGKNHQAAWAAALGMSDAALDRALLSYLRTDRYQVLTTAFRPEPVKLYTRALTLAEEEGLRAMLWQTCHACSSAERDARVQKHAQRALSLDPKQPEARLLVALRLPAQERDSLLRQMTMDTRDDVRGWLALLHWAGKFEDTHAVERAIALAPRHPLARVALAAHQSLRGDPQGALANAERALRIQPTNSWALAFYANLLFQIGRCDDVVEVIRRLRGLVHSRVPLPTLARQNEIMRTCAGPVSP